MADRTTVANLIVGSLLVWANSCASSRPQPMPWWSASGEAAFRRAMAD